MLPMAVVSEARRQYNDLDLADWSRHWNAINAQQGSLDKPIQLRFPDIFPIRSPTMLRCAIAEPNCVPLLCMFSSFTLHSNLVVFS